MMRHLAYLLLCAACSNKLHHGIDAPPPDVAVDAFSPPQGDPTANAVKLTITRGGAPVAGAPVVFQAADASLVRAGLTSESGVAWAEVGPGGFVTAIDHAGGGLDELTTFAAVQPADALVLELDPSGAKDVWPVAISIPADSGAAGYQVYTTCGGPIGVDPAVPAETALVGCGGVADVVVVAEDDTSQPLHAFFAGSVTLPAPPATALPISGSYASLVPATFSYSNVPAIVGSVGTYFAFASPRGRVYERTAAEPASGGSAQTSLLVPSASASSLVVTTFYAQDVGTQLVYDGRAAGAPPYTLDVGAALLPPFATAPSFAGGSVTWTERAGAVTPDLVRARIFVHRDAIPSGRAWGWRIVAPRTGPSVAYPPLPNLGVDFNPAAGDTVTVSELTTAAVPGDYAAARPVGFGDLVRLVIGGTDRAVVQILNQSEL